MGKNVLSHGMRVVSFLLICVLLLSGLNRVFAFKYGDGIEGLQVFYEQPEDSVDVLCIGSSHVFENVNTGLLWDEWGMSSFDLAGSIQPLWNTYFYLKEALKTQHPRVIVLDVYGARLDDEYSDQSRIIKNTFGMEAGVDKLEAKQVSAPEDSFMEYVLEFPHYHARYADITSQDFLDRKGMKDREAWKGFGINFTTKSLPKNIDVSGITEKKPLQEKTLVYLERIIELCKSSGIPLVLVCSPYALTSDDQRKYNTVADIARESDIPFLNYNLMREEAGIDFTGELSDLASDAGHLNHRGNIKYTKHLGAWLKSNYDIPDRRGDSNFTSWQISADSCRAQLADQSLKETKGLADWLKAVMSREDLTTVLVAKKPDLTSDAKLMEALAPIGAWEGDASSPIDQKVFVMHGSSVGYSSSGGDYLWHEEVHSGELMVKCKDGDSLIQLGYDTYIPKNNGVAALTYDNTTGQFVECAWWSTGDLNAKNALAPKGTAS